MSEKIQLIAIDLDGTLLDSHGRLSARNKAAIRAAQERGIIVILATGKSRASAEHLIDELGLRAPGVFTQGLTIYDADGHLVQETTLDRDVATAVIAYLETHNLLHIVHVGDRLLTPADSPARDLLHHTFDEPLAEIVGPLSPQLAALRINKILVHDPTNSTATRAALTALVDLNATVLQAVPAFIEVVPPGTSKGDGVTAVLAMLDIPAEAMLAIGDGENDVEMLQLAGIGVAMGNAHPAAHAVANITVSDHNHDGVAEAIEQLALPR